MEDSISYDSISYDSISYDSISYDSIPCDFMHLRHEVHSREVAFRGSCVTPLPNTVTLMVTTVCNNIEYKFGWSRCVITTDEDGRFDANAIREAVLPDDCVPADVESYSIADGERKWHPLSDTTSYVLETYPEDDRNSSVCQEVKIVMTKLPKSLKGML